MISRVLDEVEDEFSGETNEPANWMKLDRMFPPQQDRISKLRDNPDVWQAVTKGHYLIIGSNGSIEFWRLAGDRHNPGRILDYSKPGADGKGVPS